MKAQYIGKKCAQFSDHDTYDVTIKSVYACRPYKDLPGQLVITDPDGDFLTISEDGGKTMKEGWELVLTREEARIALRAGMKVANQYFDRDEYIYLKGGIVTTEDGYNYESVFFDRSIEFLNKDWRIHRG